MLTQRVTVTDGVTTTVPAGGATTVGAGTICSSTIDVSAPLSGTEAAQQGIKLPGYSVGWDSPESVSFIRTAIDLAADGKLSGGGLVSDDEFLQAVVEVGAGWGPAAQNAGQQFTREDFIRHVQQRVVATGGTQTRKDAEDLADAVFAGVDLTGKAVQNFDKAVREVLSKALVDDAFRKELITNPKGTLAQYNLTSGQLQAFEGFEDMRLSLMSHQAANMGLGMAM